MGASVYEDPPFIIMELMINGNALDFIRDKPTANRLLLVNSASLINVDWKLIHLVKCRSTKSRLDSCICIPEIPYMET